jgi:hypothetical protein
MTNEMPLIMIFIVNNALHVSGVFCPSSGVYKQYVQLMVVACIYIIIGSYKIIRWSRGSSVCIATRYGLEDPGIESRWGEIFLTYPDRLRGPPSLLYNGYRVFLGGKGGRGVMLITHPLLVPRLRKSWAIPALTLWALLGLLRGSLYLTKFLVCGIFE